MELTNITDYISFSIKGIFLLLLALSASIYRSKLGRYIPTILKDNVVVANLVFFSLIYFAVTTTIQNDDGSNEIDPINALKLTSGIFVFFIVLGDCDYYCSCISIVLLLAAYFNYTFYKHAKKSKQMSRFKSLKRLQNILYLLILVTLIVGATLSFLRKSK